MQSVTPVLTLRVSVHARWYLSVSARWLTGFLILRFGIATIFQTLTDMLHPIGYENLAAHEVFFFHLASIRYGNCNKQVFAVTTLDGASDTFRNRYRSLMYEKKDRKKNNILHSTGHHAVVVKKSAPSPPLSSSLHLAEAPMSSLFFCALNYGSGNGFMTQSSW